MKQKLILIGNGMAGMRAIEELLKRAPDRYEITVFGAEPFGNYNRIMLSPVLAGETTIADIMINDLDWYDTNNIRLYANDPVVSIDRDQQRVISNSGVELPYDKLILATGSNPFMLPLPGSHLSGVISYRDIHDVEKMLAAAAQHQKAVVIGGGLLGLEAANGLKKQGMDVTVVHISDYLLNMQLDEYAGRMLQRNLEARGIHFCLNAASSEILGEERVQGIRFADGRELEADIIVMAVGIRPNFALAASSGLLCERGIVVDDTLQTSDANIYAVGECVQHRGQTYGLVAPLYEQAEVLAAHLAGPSDAAYAGSIVSTKLKVTGINLFSAGNFHAGDERETLVLRDPANGVYKKLVIEDDRLIGAVLYGDVQDGSWYFDLILDRTPISHVRDILIFGQALVSDATLHAVPENMATQLTEQAVA